MTGSLVVCDASVALAWLKDDGAPAWVAALIDATARGETAIRVPTLFWLEVTNILSRQHALTDERAMEAVIRLEALGIATIEMDRPLRLRTLQLAREHQLTTYDATYLAMALDSGGTLATLDEHLGRAASGLGCRHADDDRPPRVAEPRAAYGSHRAADPMSLAAIGAYLAELRAETAR